MEKRRILGGRDQKHLAIAAEKR
ncbi:hypothetical protein RV420_390148 [Roseovarius sp. EC-SD190]|nr:hypothetical protein RV420_390148 [Roseovarius sp. EC-SD190]